jgi:hypothetical protein
MWQRKKVQAMLHATKCDDKQLKHVHAREDHNLFGAYEATSVVIHLVAHPSDFQKFKDGELDVPMTLKTAKAAIPPIGKLYGILTEEFVHVGKPFWHIQKGNIYSASEWEMWQCGHILLLIPRFHR